MFCASCCFCFVVASPISLKKSASFPKISPLTDVTPLYLPPTYLSTIPPFAPFNCVNFQVPLFVVIVFMVIPVGVVFIVTSAVLPSILFFKPLK